MIQSKRPVRRLSLCVLSLVVAVRCVSAADAPDAGQSIIDSDGLLYRVTLWKNNDADNPVVIEGGSMGTTRHEEAMVTTRVENGDRPGERKWFIEVAPSDGYGVYEVQYPLLVLTPLSGPENERLVVPFGYGRVIRDPFNYREHGQNIRPRKMSGIHIGAYGSGHQNLQMVLYEDGKRGVMVWTQDADLYPKDFEVSKSVAETYKGKGLRCTVRHQAENAGRVGVGFKASYPVVTTPYEGPWYVPARIYRQWALKQPWCSKGTILQQIDRGELPRWWAKNSMWMVAIQPGDESRMKQVREAFPGPEIGVFFTNWQRWHFGSEHLPEYFPPKDEPGYRRILALQKEGLHIFPYMNISLVEMAYPPMGAVFKDALAVPPPTRDGWFGFSEFWGKEKTKTQALQDDVTAAWNKPLDSPEAMRVFAKIQSNWFGGYFYEKDKLERLLRDNWGKDPTVIAKISVKYAHDPICRGTDTWLNWHLGNYRKSYDEYGADGAYLDTLCGSYYPCFSDSHPHKPGFGRFWFEDTRKFMATLRSEYPDRPIFGEDFFEGYIGLLQESYVINPRFTRFEILPLIPTVYHDYISMHQWPIQGATVEKTENFAAALAPSAHFGHKAAVMCDALFRMLEEEHRPRRELFKALVDLQLTHIDTLVYGVRLQAPTVVDPGTHTVTWAHDWKDTASSTHRRPLIEASCWGSSRTPGRVVLLLSNSGAEARSTKVVCPDVKKGTKLTDQDGNVIIHDPDVVIETKGFSYRALQCEPAQ